MTRQSYTYTSNPHAAPRALFSQSVPLTMMSDPRVVRGNTHTLAKKATMARVADNDAKHKSDQPPAKAAPARLHTEPTQPYYRYEVKPFSSLESDMAKYLEAENDLEIRRKDVVTEMDELIPRTEDLPFVPRKTGIDATTQVTDVSELFNFNLEVTPILEVIVAKTLEQALLEVNAEEEIASLHAAASQYHEEQEREAQWMHAQMELLKEEELEQTEARKLVKMKKAAELEMKTNIAGVNMIRQLLPDMIDKIAKKQVKSGAWKTSDKVAFERQLWPATLRAVDANRDAYFAAQQVVDGKPLTPQKRVCC